MRRIVFTSFLCGPLLAAADPFVGNFKGFYGGPVVVFGKSRLGVTNQRYKKTRLMLGALAGYGHVFSGTNWYLGHEWTLVSDTFSDKKAGQKLKKSDHVEALVRFGEVIEYNFLPYAALGAYYACHSLKSPTINKTFGVSGIIGEVGVDAFCLKQVTIRSSVRYQRGLAKHGGDAGIDVQKMPQGVLLKVGVSYQLN